MVLLLLSPAVHKSNCRVASQVSGAPDSLFDLLTGDAYTAKMEKVYSQGCDPVTGAPNLDFEPMQKDAGHSGVFLPSSGLTGTEHNPLPAHHMPTY